MENDQYAATADFQDYRDDGPPKTSVLAILSLVCSLVCFIPGLSAIGALLGVFGLIRITSSNGRIRGTGLAIAGIAIGVIVSLIWIGGAIAVQQGAKQYLEMSAVIGDVDSGSYDLARGHLTSATRPFATDEAFEQFKAKYEADAGAFAGRPQGIGELFSSFGALGQSQDPNNAPRVYPQQAPVPGKFDNGYRWIIVSISTNEQNDAGTFPAIDNVGVWLSDDSLIWLIDPDVLAAGNPPATSDESDPAESETDSNEETPADTGG
ncbi:MAG: DUF4190 domain-containing protein [Phycisphaera sp.]|nr:MAG: DUF4190 domain-containing protein [Phycisphaera sp.]